MKRHILALPFIVFATAVSAACPDPANVEQELDALIARAQSAETFSEGRAVAGEMWELWLRAPDEAAKATLDAGMRRREVADFGGAMREFNRLAEYCPTYAEGYNQRAFTNFLRGAFDLALVDLDRALALQPRHIGALSGRALTLMNLGRIEEARDQMIEAVALNPWLSEKALLAEGAPLGPPGKKL